MAIAKRPKSNQTLSPPAEEQAAEAFITKTATPPTATPPKGKTPVLVRFDNQLLQRIDEAAQHRGISRAAWIQFVLSRALDQGDG